MRDKLILALFVACVGTWAWMGARYPQPYFPPRTEHIRLLEAWPELQKETGMEAKRMPDRAWQKAVSSLQCGCAADGATLYCALCLKCEPHCRCTAQQREDAYLGYLCCVANPKLMAGVADRFLAEKRGR